MIDKIVKQFIFSMAVLAVFVFSGTAHADLIVFKAYKQAFPNTHPKCINCHVNALPKKAEGRHEWNPYGQTVKKEAKDAGIPDVPSAGDVSKFIAILDKVGKVEDFKGK